MAFLKIQIKYSTFYFSLFFLISCELDTAYLWHISKNQLKLLNHKVPIEKALKEYDLTKSEKKKLNLISKIKTFALKNLSANINEDIYSSYVQLDRPHVTYILRVSSIYALKAYLWNFPITGLVPYKGFFDKEKAIKESESFSKEKYDTYLGGVSAYSTLGWFEDAILSSMLAYEESDFVVTIFHELVHTVLFFKDHINFNERFAEFLGRQTAILFYLNKEGSNSKAVKKMKMEWHDKLLFSSFMVKEYKSLDQWYTDNKGKITLEIKQKRLKEIQERFLTELKPKLKTQIHYYFSKIKLNNALLLSYRSYNFNMEEFEKLFNSNLVNKNIKAFIEYSFQFEEEDDPEEAFSKALEKIK